MAGPEPIQSPKTAKLDGKTTFPPDLGHGASRAETELGFLFPRQSRTNFRRRRR